MIFEYQAQTKGKVLAIDWSKSYWVPPPPVLVPLDEVLAMFGYTREELEALPDDD